MSKRLPSEDRRAQVVQATLRLLGEVPLEKLTTRLVAAEVETSQPALFRHFRSRDALLVAVVEEARSTMGALAARTLELDDPLVALETLVRGLFEFAAVHPGLPRLLFHDVTGRGDAPYHRPLRLMVSMQASLVENLVRTAQERGAVHPDTDPKRAAFLLTALMQGVLAQWQHGGRERDLSRDAADLISLWTAGVAAGAPVRAEAGEGPETSARCALASLDARPLIAAGRDPLEAILGALDGVERGGVLEIVAPFRPVPLLTLLRGQGHGVDEEGLPGDLVRVTVRRGDEAPLLDLRGLEAPEPLERILAASAELLPGARLVARMPRVPELLFPHLTRRGLQWSVLESLDGTALLQVRRAGERHEG